MGRPSVLDRLDASVSFSPEEAMLLENVRALATHEIGPRAAAHDENSAFPWGNVGAINALGLNAMFVPEAYGGAPLSYVAYLAAVREISAACASTGIIWATTFHAMRPVIAFGATALKERLLPKIAAGALGALAITEPEAGSDATAMTTRFREDGDSIVIDGRKSFITNGDVADAILVFGKWAGIADPRKAITAIVVEKGAAGLSVLRTEQKLGHRASSTAALAFDECLVPRGNLVGGPGEGLRILLASLNTSRPSVAAHALGIARAAFTDAVTYVNERRQGGSRVIDHQAIQTKLADHAADLALTEAWLWHVGRLVDAGAEDFAVEASILKLRASDLAMRVATDAVQLFGGYGYCQDFRVERLFRDAKVTQIWEGTNEIHRQFIGRSFREARDG